MRYLAPRSEEDVAHGLAADPSARILAGGTDLLVQLAGGRQAPSAIIDIKRVASLTSVRRDEARRCVVLGAAASAAEIVEHTEIGRLWPGLVEAVGVIGSTQIQGRATVGGNVCNASPAADSVPALVANRALCLVRGPAGVRSVPVENFSSAPGRTVLAPGEFLAALELPLPAPGTGDAFLRLIPRSEMDIAVANTAVSLTLDRDGRCRAARVAIGAVGPSVILVEEAERALVGTNLEPAACEAAAEAARAAARPIDDRRGTARYRRQVVGVLVERAIRAARARTAGEAA